MMYFGDYTLFYNSLPIPGWLLVLAIFWTVPWKGVALWRAARNHQRGWFVILLVFNSLGILEIIYLKFWQKECSYCSLGEGPEDNILQQEDKQNNNVNLPS